MIAAAGRAGASGDRQRAVVVAMIAVRMLQMAADQVIDVVAVRHRFVPAAGPMHMTGAMAGTVVLRRAAVRIGGADGDHVLVDMVAMHVVQMAVVQEIDVPVVLDPGVSAVFAVDVLVAVVLLAVPLASLISRRDSATSAEAGAVFRAALMTRQPRGRPGRVYSAAASRSARSTPRRAVGSSATARGRKPP